MKTLRNMLQSLSILIVLLGTATLLSAQELTNDKVLRMIKAELSESTIIAAIQSDPAGLDTSADELIRMKEGGASKAVLDAMLAAKAKPSAPPAAAPPVMQPVPNFNQVLAVVGDRRIELQQGGEMKASGSPFGGKVRQTFKAAKSPTRLPAGDTAFELHVMGNVRPEEVIALAIPELRKNERRVEIARTSGFMAVSTSGGNKTVVQMKFEKVGDSTFPGVSAPKYRLTPESQLVSGEYVLIVNQQFFDFGVDGD